MHTLIQKDLEKVTDWCISHKLSVNITKTKYMSFPAKAKNEYKDVKLYLNNQRLQQVYSYKYLGIMLDPDINYDMFLKQQLKNISYRTYTGQNVGVSIVPGAFKNGRGYLHSGCAYKQCCKAYLHSGSAYKMCGNAYSHNSCAYKQCGNAYSHSGSAYKLCGNAYSHSSCAYKQCGNAYSHSGRPLLSS